MEGFAQKELPTTSLQSEICNREPIETKPVNPLTSFVEETLLSRTIPLDRELFGQAK